MIITDHHGPDDGRVTVVQGPAYTATVCTSQEDGDDSLSTIVLDGDHTGSVVAKCSYVDTIDVAGRHAAHRQVVADLNVAAGAGDLLIATKAAFTQLKEQGVVRTVRIAF